MILFDLVTLCSLLNFEGWCLKEVYNDLQIGPPFITIDVYERCDRSVEILKIVFLVHVSALRNEGLELFEKFTMRVTVNRRYSTVIIERELWIWYFTKDVHDEFKTGLLEVFLTLRI